MQVIIFRTDAGETSVVHPSAMAVQEKGIGYVAAKSVPFGKPYKILDLSEIPLDRHERDQWEIDESLLTDGIGEALV